MSRPGRAVVGGLVLLLLGATPAVAQSVTGIGKQPGPLGPTDPAASTDTDWTSWSEDEVVARLVHQPVKTMGVRGLDRDVLIDLKGLMTLAEADVRAVVDALASGDVNLHTARTTLEDVLLAYRIALEDITTK